MSKTPQEQRPASRRPTAFALDENTAAMPINEQADTRPKDAPKRPPRSFAADITITPDAEDPFLSELASDDAIVPIAIPRKRGFSFGKLAAAAKTGNLDNLKTAFGAAAGTCKACHDNYRAK